MRSLALVRPRRWGRRALALFFALSSGLTLALAYVPWWQSVIGYGKVTVFDPADRPQPLEAQIPGRLVKWYVADGQRVKRGQVVARIDDIDSKFLNPRQVAQTERQRAQLAATLRAARDRAARFEALISQELRSRGAAVPIARERAARAGEVLRGLGDAVREAEAARDRVRLAQIPQADFQILQARETLDERKANLRAATAEVRAQELRFERMKGLVLKQLRAQQDYEFAERDLSVATEREEAARRSVAVAEKGVDVAKQNLEGLKLELRRADEAIKQRRAALDAGRRDTTIGGLDVDRTDADTAARINNFEATLQSVRETVFKTEADITKLDIELDNLRLRAGQQAIRAPRDGRIVRLRKVGEGATVKAGDVLAELAPDTQDAAVELTVSDNDAPLITVGRKVRLQIAGWPALQFSGWPAVSVGTFAGEVAVIDAVDDGKSRYRVIVRPDWERIRAKKEDPWPPLGRLRPGAEVTGWVLLDRVSLGFELWRQFNAFPPTVRRDLTTDKPGKDDELPEDKLKAKSPKVD